ncbi:MAG TPA: hypothetical protein PLX64_02835 [Flavobacteriales bacterium]|nr:hypothetical protein [Flavobacteriales bacterium]HQX29264.1 hypothetical protein [Flavobacteriales bacterium]HQZ91956.1 hypothetical protein [Flavobacteriales bacterium]
MSNTLPTMKKQATNLFLSALLTGLCALIGIGLFAAPGNETTTDKLVLTGWLHMDTLDAQDVVLAVELGDSECMFAKVQPNGRFEFHVPVNVKARLIFYKPGFITKSVDVDTRNALNTKDAQKANQKVDFDVILEANDIHRGLEYAGPVGAITFLNGSGLMKVKHDRKMIPVETMAALAGE